MLMIYGAPVLWIPYYVQYLYDLDRFPVQVIPGKNSEWGFFALSRWRYHLIDSPELTSKGTIHADYREKRGFGVGVDNSYRSQTLGRGILRTYYTQDDNPPAEAEDGEDRYRASWRHQAKLAKDTTLVAELNKLSDPTIIKDFFFREEYEKEAFPDNYVSIITAKPEYTLSLLVRERMDDFFSVVERSPEVRFDTQHKQFQDTRFYLRQESQFSHLKKQFANIPDGAGLDAVRYDNNWTLTYAGRVGDLSVVPHIGTRQTYYSRDLPGDNDVFRGIFDGGVDMNMRFFKTYDFYTRAFGLDYNQIRHIFAPSASYNYRPNPTVSRTVLQQFDALDALDKQHFIRFSLDNKFQTKEHVGKDKTKLKAREIARIIPFFDMDYHEDRIQNVGIDVELRPYSWMGIESDATYDTVTRDFLTVNADFYLTRGPFSFSLGQRYLRNESSQTTAGIDWQIRPDLHLKVYERFEFEDKENQEFELTLSKTIDCVILDFTYNHQPDEEQFYFALRLTAFPEAAIGYSQSYGRPKSSPRPSRSYF